jgi:hypothetical protein
VPFLFRRIANERWDPAVTELDSPLPSDPLADLVTKRGNLSLWLVTDDRSNLDRVITAVAANAGVVSNVPFVLIQRSLLEEHGFRIVESRGNTPLSEAVNEHRDVVGLDAGRLVEMAELFRRHGVFEEYSESRVRLLLAEAVNRRRLRRQDLKPDVQSHLERRGLI